MRRTIALTTIAAGSVLAIASLGGWTASREAATTATILETVEAQRVYTVDNVHSSVLFRVRHAGIANFYGRFNEIKGEIHFDAADITNSRMTFTVPTASVDSNNTNRDNHLRNADFFNARQFAEIAFTSTGIKEVSTGVYELAGNLTLHGETRPITARLTDVATGKVRDNDAIGFEATFTITRSEFGMTNYLATDRSDNGPLGNTVQLTVAIEAIAR